MKSDCAWSKFDLYYFNSVQHDNEMTKKDSFAANVLSGFPHLATCSRSSSELASSCLWYCCEYNTNVLFWSHNPGPSGGSSRWMGGVLQWPRRLTGVQGDWSYSSMAAVGMCSILSVCLCDSGWRAGDEAAGRDSQPKDDCVFIAGSPRASHSGLEGHGYQSAWHRYKHTHLCYKTNKHKLTHTHTHHF